jgi:YVTN family beta-propeller protein
VKKGIGAIGLLALLGSVCLRAVDADFYQPARVVIAGTTAYVTNYQNNTVGVVNATAETLAGTVTPGAFPFSGPVGIAIDGGANTAYVANTGGNLVSYFLTTTNTVGGYVTDVPATFAVPTEIAIAAGNTAYVTNNSAAASSVSYFDTNTKAVLGTVSSLSQPQEVAILGTFAYLTSYATDTVSKINLATTKVVDVVVVGTSPKGIAIDPVALVAYVANSGSDTISKINLVTCTPIIGGGWPVALAGSPTGIALDGAGNLYVTCPGNATVSRVTPAGVLSWTTPVAGSPTGIVLDAFTGDLFVTCPGANSVARLTTVGVLVVGWPVAVGGGTTPTGIVSDGAGNLYVTCPGSGNVAQVTTAGVVTPAWAGIGVGTTPTGIVIDPGMATLYVTCLGSGNVAKIAIVGPIITPVWVIIGGAANPRGIAINAGNSSLCVANSGDDTATHIALPGGAKTAITDFGGFSSPYGITYDSWQQRLYVTNFDGRVVIINPTLAVPKVVGKITDTGFLFNGPREVAVHPTSPVAYVTNAAGNKVSVVDTTTNTVTSDLLDASFNAPFGIVLNAANNRAYVTNSANPPNSSVTVMNITVPAAPTVLGIVTPGVYPFDAPTGIALVGTKGFVANFGPLVYVAPNRVSVVDLTTSQVAQYVQVPPPLQPPTDLAGYQAVMGDVTHTIQPTVTPTVATFFTQIDWINALTWGAPGGVPTPASYNVYRDAALTQLIGTALGTTPSFADHNRTPGVMYTYYVSPQVLANVLSWNAPTSGTAPAEYRVYRDATLNILAGPAIPATAVPLQFIDYNRVAGTPDTYYVVSADGLGNKSTAVSVTVPSFD